MDSQRSCMYSYIRLQYTCILRKNKPIRKIFKTIKMSTKITYMNPQQYFKKINESKRHIERLQYENVKLRHRLSEFQKLELSFNGSKIEKVKSVINQFYNIDIEAKTREITYVRGRRIFYVWLKANTVMSLKAIGGTIPLHQDHSSIIHALKQHQDYMDTDKHYQKEYNDIITLINTVLEANTENK